MNPVLASPTSNNVLESANPYRFVDNKETVKRPFVDFDACAAELFSKCATRIKVPAFPLSAHRSLCEFLFGAPLDRKTAKAESPPGGSDITAGSTTTFRLAASGALTSSGASSERTKML